MANNFDTSLVNATLAQKAITGLAGKIAYAPLFSTDFSDELRDQRSLTINVPVVVSGSTVETGTISDYETSSTTMSSCLVTMQEVNTSFELSPTDLNNGLRLTQLADRNLADFQAKIESLIFAQVTEANFGTVSSTLSGVTSGALSVDNIHDLWGQLPGNAASKILIVKSGEMVKLLPSDLNSFDVTKQRSGYGFGAVESTDSGFASAGSKIIAFAAQPSALALASALPAYTNMLGDVVDMQVITLADLGISIVASVWISAKTRKVYGSYSTLFGAKAADKTALKVAKSL